MSDRMTPLSALLHRERGTSRQVILQAAVPVLCARHGTSVRTLFETRVRG